jgi:hypothetical protein
LHRSKAKRHLKLRCWRGHFSEAYAAPKTGPQNGAAMERLLPYDCVATGDNVAKRQQ